MANQAPDDQAPTQEYPNISSSTKRRTPGSSNSTETPISNSTETPISDHGNSKRRRGEAGDLPENKPAEGEKSTGNAALVRLPHRDSARFTLLSPGLQSQAQLIANLEAVSLAQAPLGTNALHQRSASSLALSPALTTLDTAQLSAILSGTSDPRLGATAILQNNALANQIAVNNAIQALVQRETQIQIFNNLILQRQQEAASPNQRLISSLSNNILTAAQASNAGELVSHMINPVQLARAPSSLLTNLLNPMAVTVAASTPSIGTTTSTQQSAEASPAVASLPATESSPKEILLYLPMDDGNLTEYQVLMRKQIVITQADEYNIQEDTQGRRLPLALGQASIQCRHCKHKPFRQRGKGSVYYPTSLDRLYQTCQNMSNIHLRKTCTCIDPDIRQQLNALCGIRGRAIEGKQYWADGGKAIGLYESNGALYLKDDGKD